MKHDYLHSVSIHVVGEDKDRDARALSLFVEGYAAARDVWEESSFPDGTMHIMSRSEQDLGLFLMVAANNDFVFVVRGVDKMCAPDCAGCP